MPKISVKQMADGFQIQLPEDDELAKVDPQKIQAFITSRLACASRNRCAERNRTIAERLDCAFKLAERRIGQVGQTTLAAQPLQVETKKSAKGLQINVKGAQYENFKQAFQESKIEEGLNAIRACRQANRCGARNQTLAERWQCVSTLGARRFAKE